MVSFGIPIVSSRVAGIPEVLGENYPYFVDSIENEDEYIKKLLDIQANVEQAKQDMMKIRERVLAIHNTGHFSAMYLRIIGLTKKISK
jgi:glycosyltransferase involved in cell wall biosynthesis